MSEGRGKRRFLKKAAKVLVRAAAIGLLFAGSMAMVEVSTEAGADYGYRNTALNNTSVGGNYTSASVAGGGQTISMDVRNVDLRDVLSALAIKMGLNVILIDENAVEVTVKLNNVPAQRALEMIIQKYGYAHIQNGNTIVVGKASDLQNNFFDQMLMQKFETNYVRGEEINGALKEFGIPYKCITSTSNPYAIWVEGTVETLQKTRELINLMDGPASNQFTDYRVTELKNISPARALELLQQAGIKVEKYVKLDNRIMFFDPDIVKRWEEVQSLIKDLDTDAANKEGLFVYKLKNITAQDAADRLKDFDFGEKITIKTYNYANMSHEIMVICPQNVQKQVYRAINDLDMNREKIKAPVLTKDGSDAVDAYQSLDAVRTLINQLTGVPMTSMNISSNISGDDKNPKYVLWVEETPDRIQLIKNMIKEMGL
ncbi:MAG: energy transducer TonB [Bacillota bacterium]